MINRDRPAVEDADTETLAGISALWARLYDPLVRFAWLLVGDRAKAEDLVSSTFLRTYGRLLALRDPEPYLRRALVNAARSEWRHEEAGLRATAKLTVREEFDERLVELLDVLEALPHRQRAVVVLRHLYGYDDAAIAELLGCRVATVRSHARHGLARLREVLP
ncbi:MAG: sigma-70 family RNA polymerase sigma factor [Acidimicrobiales bacterium]